MVKKRRGFAGGLVFRGVFCSRCPAAPRGARSPNGKKRHERQPRRLLQTHRTLETHRKSRFYHRWQMHHVASARRIAAASLIANASYSERTAHCKRITNRDFVTNCKRAACSGRTTGCSIFRKLQARHKLDLKSRAQHRLQMCGALQSRDKSRLDHK